jgi:hypothetical protein
MEYTVKKVKTLPEIYDLFKSDNWSSAGIITIDTFLSPGHNHKPLTKAKLVHDGNTIAVMFEVTDNYIIAKGTNYQDRTHKDSCIEFFIEPIAEKGYFNFEFNCCGTLLLSYIEDATRKGDGFEKYEMIPEDAIIGLEVHTSLSDPIFDEIQIPTTWTISYRIPKSIFERYLGNISTFSGMTMRGNLYKCADESSHPHWGYWADIGDILDFHQPNIFNYIHLES